MRRYSDGLHSLYQYYGEYGTTLIIPEGFIVSGIGNVVFVLYIILYYTLFRYDNNVLYGLIALLLQAYTTTVNYIER